MAIAGLRRADKGRRAEDLLETVGLEGRMNHKPAELSRGEQQRVVIVRALANNAKFSLMDEPTGNIDSKAATEILDLIKNINEEKSVTVIIARATFPSRNCGHLTLVAGIGIMNIMIVSLIDRTREIGILKALGMRSQTVFMVFLCESAIIGLIGAVVGIASGWVLANIVALVFRGRGAGVFGGNRSAAIGEVTITPLLTPTVTVLALVFAWESAQFLRFIQLGEHRDSNQ